MLKELGVVQCKIDQDYYTFGPLKFQDEATTLTKFKEFAYQF